MMLVGVCPVRVLCVSCAAVYENASSDSTEEVKAFAETFKVTHVLIVHFDLFEL